MSQSSSFRSWVPKEDLTIVNFLSTKGTKWASIARRLKNRTDTQVKNRFYATMRRVHRHMKNGRRQKSDKDTKSVMYQFCSALMQKYKGDYHRSIKSMEAISTTSESNSSPLALSDFEDEDGNSFVDLLNAEQRDDEAEEEDEAEQDELEKQQEEDQIEEQEEEHEVEEQDDEQKVQTKVHRSRGKRKSRINKRKLHDMFDESEHQEQPEQEIIESSEEDDHHPIISSSAKESMSKRQREEHTFVHPSQLTPITYPYSSQDVSASPSTYISPEPRFSFHDDRLSPCRPLSERLAAQKPPSLKVAEMMPPDTVNVGPSLQPIFGPLTPACFSPMPPIPVSTSCIQHTSFTHDNPYSPSISPTFVLSPLPTLFPSTNTHDQPFPTSQMKAPLRPINLRSSIFSPSSSSLVNIHNNQHIVSGISSSYHKLRLTNPMQLWLSRQTSTKASTSRKFDFCDTSLSPYTAASTSSCTAPISPLNRSASMPSLSTSLSPSHSPPCEKVLPSSLLLSSVSMSNSSSPPNSAFLPSPLSPPSPQPISSSLISSSSSTRPFLSSPSLLQRQMSPSRLQTPSLSSSPMPPLLSTTSLSSSSVAAATTITTSCLPDALSSSPSSFSPLSGSPCSCSSFYSPCRSPPYTGMLTNAEQGDSFKCFHPHTTSVSASYVPVPSTSV